ncbi:MAG: hypothetical protein LBH56_00305, partial [Coriobacteriales bacterium]|nr:hypothetical protein [Coriobacteriales bacterium]
MPKEEIVARIASLRTLQYIAKPYATFVPIGEDFEFSEGKEIDVRLRVFGFLDLGLHHIRI